jgi:hypothetical protein
VEGVVDGRPARAPCGVVGGGVSEALPFGLRGEGDDGGRAAHGRRPRGGLERVGVHLAHAGHLFDMAMGIDTAGGDDEARGVERLGPREVRPERCDPAIRMAMSAVNTASAVATWPPLMTRSYSIHATLGQGCGQVQRGRFTRGCARARPGFGEPKGTIWAAR